VDAAFRAEELSWSKTRLLGRIAVPETESAWIERARSLSCRALEREIKASDKGLPPRKGSKGLPAVRVSVKFKLDPLSHEMWEQARRRMAAEQGEEISEAELARFTLVGATTDPDRVPVPLRARFGIQETLEPYGDGAITSILGRAVERDGLEIDADALEVLARAALGIPRKALRLWRRVRDAATAHVRARITVHDVRAALEAAGIDERGLGPVHRKVLGVLDGRRGQPLGPQRLAALARVSTRALRTVFEPELLRLGLLSVTPRGLVAVGGA
jgi:hypothetical protein